MKALYYQKRLAILRHRHQRLQGLVGCLAVIALLQVILLYFRHERVVIHPPEMTQSYWVQGNRFSSSYLEEMARYMCHLMLDVTPDSLPLQAQILLRYAAPTAYGALKAQLVSDVNRLRQQQLCLHFVPKSTAVSLTSLSIKVTGELHRYMGTRRLDSEQRTWQVTFSQTKGQLFLKAFESVDARREGKI
jgi:conjugal transfer pilus assembly protein TraE